MQLTPCPQLRKTRRYRIDHCLGTGGMGQVFRAWDHQLKCPVALKRLLPEAAQNPKAKERFRQEIQVADELDHPHLVHLHDWVADDSGDCMIMELVEGKTLRQCLGEGPLAVEFAISLAHQIAEGLAAIHAKGFLHRDLKPENIMVTTDGKIKILDFGLTRPLSVEDDVSNNRRLCGTVSAMSPEQVLERPLDQRSDLFALGILLYEMVTGIAPFRTPETRRTLIHILTKQPAPTHELRPEVPRPFSDLIHQMLHKEPTRRPSSAALVSRICATMLGGKPGRGKESFTFKLEPRDLQMETEDTRLTVADAALPLVAGVYTRSCSTASAAIRPNNPTI